MNEGNPPNGWASAADAPAPAWDALHPAGCLCTDAVCLQTRLASADRSGRL